MGKQAVEGLVTGGIAIIVGPLLGWIIAVAFPWIFQNSTGGYSTPAAQSIANNVQLIFIGLGLLVGVIIAIVSVTSAMKR
jgi:hypothetical protein